MSRRLRAVIFDVDGTLVDSQNHIALGMDAAFGALGRQAPVRAEVLGIVGLSLPEAFAVLAPWATAEENAVLVAEYKASYIRLRGNAGASSSPLYPGARDALEQLKTDDHVLLGVATGKSRRGLDILLDSHGLTGFFDTEQVADHHPSKPHPAMLRTALSELGLEAADAVMVGDTSFDMDMAAASGMRGIGVAWGYHSVERLSSASIIIETYDALPGAVGALLGDTA